MTLHFANPALLPWLALAALPVVAHLLVKARPPVFRFGSLRFVRQVARANLRLRKPWDWVLLAARVLLIVILVLLLSRPRLFRGSVPAVGGQRNIVLVVDASASMNAVERSRTRFSAACAEAAGILSGLRAGDRANIVWLRRTPEAEFASPGPNTDYLSDRLRRATGTQQAADIRNALVLAANQLKEGTGACEICLLSDFQASAWEDVQLALPAHVRLSVLAMARLPLANTAILSLSCRSGRAVAELPAVFDCEVRNFSAEPRAVSLTLTAGEYRENRDIQLAGEEQRSESFTCTFPETGDVAVSVALTPDRFPADDQRFLVCQVVPRLPVRLGLQDEKLNEAWHHALDALGWVQLENDGDALLIGAPDNSEAALIDHTAKATSGGPWHLAAPADDTYATIFANSGYGDPTQPSIRRRDEVPPDGRVLLRYADGVPAIVLAEKVLHWNVPLDAVGGDLPQHAEVLLPLVGEALLALDQQSRPPQMEHSPGARLQLRGFVPDEGTETVLVDGDGKPIGNADQPGGVPVQRPGIHTWRSGDRVLASEAVNFPAIESDLRALPNPQRLLRADVSAGSAASLTAARDGIPLWPHLGAAAILLLIAEAALLLVMRRLDGQSGISGEEAA